MSKIFLCCPEYLTVVLYGTPVGLFTAKPGGVSTPSCLLSKYTLSIFLQNEANMVLLHFPMSYLHASEHHMHGSLCTPVPH